MREREWKRQKAYEAEKVVMKGLILLYADTLVCFSQKSYCMTSEDLEYKSKATFMIMLWCFCVILEA